MKIKLSQLKRLIREEARIKEVHDEPSPLAAGSHDEVADRIEIFSKKIRKSSDAPSAQRWIRALKKYLADLS